MSQSASDAPKAAHYTATRIYDLERPEIRELLSRVGASKPSPRDFILAVHKHIRDTMTAVYSIDEDRPVSETLRLNEGSCGQRMAAVEALARAYGIPTRVRALWLRREFWFSRLPLLRFFLPPQTLMPWSQFHIDDKWIDFDELYAPCEVLAQKTPVKHEFTNRGESLFDAIRHMPVDFRGELKNTDYKSYDISRVVASDGGFFDTRDELLEKLEPKRSGFGRWIFNTLYGGRHIRRVPEQGAGDELATAAGM